jgi:hypothetical protein
MGEQHLPTMGGTHDAGGAMHIQAYIAFGCQLRLTRVQAHVDTHLLPF